MTPREAVIALLSGTTLSAADMQSVVRGVMQGDVPDAVIAALLVLLRQKGETIEEIYGAVQAIMEFADKISLDPHAIDTAAQAAMRLAPSTFRPLRRFLLAVRAQKLRNMAIARSPASAVAPMSWKCWAFRLNCPKKKLLRSSSKPNSPSSTLRFITKP
jgi:Anthranilate phosphoribosyltransferase